MACTAELPADGAAHGVLLWSFRDPIRPEAVLESAVEAHHTLGGTGCPDCRASASRSSAHCQIRMHARQMCFLLANSPRRGWRRWGASR